MMESPNHQAVISLGGGVQSAVIAGEGAFGALSGCTNFADTHWETKA